MGEERREAGVKVMEKEETGGEGDPRVASWALSLVAAGASAHVKPLPPFTTPSHPFELVRAVLSLF